MGDKAKEKDKKKKPRKIPEDILVNALFKAAADQDAGIDNPADFVRKALAIITSQMEDKEEIRAVYMANRDYSSIEDWTCFGPWRHIDRDFTELFDGYTRFLDMDPDLRI